MGIKKWACALSKVGEYLYGKEYLEAIEVCRERLNKIEVDRTKVKPIVKITGEFWASITEGDGNFHMFNFLEREGAQVLTEPIATWVAYMLHQVQSNAENRKAIDAAYPESGLVGAQQAIREERAEVSLQNGPGSWSARRCGRTSIIAW